MRNKPRKPDIEHKGKKYWIRDVSRYRHYSNENDTDEPVICDSYDILYWYGNIELTGYEDVWFDAEFCDKLEEKVDRLFGEYTDSPYGFNY